MTSSSSLSDCSNVERPVTRERTPGRFAGFILGGALALFALGGAVSPTSAQAPPAGPGQPPTQPGQEQPQPGQEQAQPAQPAPTPPEQIPLQQYPLQQPGRQPVTPATPPSATMPPWTPPVLPAPSQTNIPAPFPLYTPGAPGAPPPAAVGMPGLTIPGAFKPTVASLRGTLLEFHPTLRLSEEYTDNFFQTTSRTEDNFRTTLGPGFVVLLNGARTFGTLSATLDLVHDTARGSGDDPKVFGSLNAAVRYALTPRLSVTFLDTFTRDDDPAVADEFGIRRGRQAFIRNTAGVTVDWLLDRVAAQAYYRNVLFLNQDEGQTGANRADTITHILGANASTRIGIDYIVRGGYEFSRSDTTGGGGADDDTTHTLFGAASRQFGLYTTGGVSSSYSIHTQDDSRIFNASVFGAYGLPTGLSVAGSVGYSILESADRDSEGAISASLQASYRFTRAIISVGVAQDFRQTSQQGQNFGTVESRSYFGSFLYQLTPFINTVLSVRYSENSPTGVGNNENEGTSTALTYGGSINWQVLRWLTASLRYTHIRQSGNSFNQGSSGTGEYKENRATLNLFATF